MQYSSRPRLALEMTMVRATRAGQIVPTAQVLEKLDLLLPGLPGAGASAGGRPEPSAHSVSMENSKPGTALSLAEPLAPSPAVPFYPEEKVQEEQKSAVLDDHPFLPEGKSLENSSPETGKSAAMRPKKEVEPSFEVGKLEQSKGVAPRDSGRDLRPQWDGFVAYVKKRKVWMAPVLEMASGVREENGELRIRYDDEADCKLLEEAANNRLLTEFAQDYFQRELTVRLRIRGGGTVAVGGEEGPQAQRRSLTRDSLVQTVVEIFNGDIANIRTAGVS